MKKYILSIIVTLFTILLVTGCGSSTEETEKAQSKNVAYFCRDTKKIVVTTQQKTPALNPETGKKTLFPAMYCKQCQQWHPAPEIEQLQHTAGAGFCPKCKTQMEITGPLPGESK